MKAVVFHQYGGPEVLTFEDRPDPVAGPGEVTVRLAATSINPFDILVRSGKAKDFFPVVFPGVLGEDVAGTILQVAPGVTGFAVGDRVIAMTNQSYAERVVVKAASVAKLRDGMDLVEAAALPLVTTTGSQLITEGTGIKAGQTVLIAGAIGGVGRSAVFAARSRGAVVIAGVRKKQLNEAATLGADRTVAIDDDGALASLAPVDAVADAVGRATAEKLIAKVKPGGVFASVLGPPANAGQFPSVKVVPVYATPDARTLLAMAEAVKSGKLVIPIDRKIPLRSAAEGHAAVEKGGIGKVLLLA